MVLQLFNSIIEDEKKMFNINEKSLEIAAKEVARAYSSSALREGNTFLDYNMARNRCAYLHKFGALHTGLVDKFFKELTTHETAKFILEHRKELKICCLGGGPGTDVVGLFKALATMQFCYRHVSQVTILDLCGGWRNSFKHVISRLKHGKVDGVPVGFIDSHNFEAKLIQVNLLMPLTATVRKVIANADIICMSKFVSAILGKKESVGSLKVIAENIKLGALVLILDNFHRNIFGVVETFSIATGFSTILGPKYVPFKNKGSKSKNDMFGCPPLLSVTVSVIGYIKTMESPVVTKQISVSSCTDIEENDDSWDTDSETEDNSVVIKNKCKKISTLTNKTIPDKFTQTDSKLMVPKFQSGLTDVALESEEFNELPSLMETLSNLLSVAKRLQQMHCCCCRFKTQHRTMINSHSMSTTVLAP